MVRSVLFMTLLIMTGVQAEESKIRKVLFIVSDNLKASALGAYGNTICKTPDIDHLAQRGMFFERTYCQAGLSPSQFQRTFSRVYGVSPIAFVTRLRIDEARRLLHDRTLSMADDATGAGFASQAFFSTRFRTITGLSPSAYRKALGDAPNALTTQVG